MSLTLLWECNWDLVQVTQLGSNKVRSTVRQLATAISEGYTPSGNVWKVIWRVLYLRNSLSKGTVTTSIKKSFILVCSWNRWLKRWILIDFFSSGGCEVQDQADTVSAEDPLAFWLQGMGGKERPSFMSLFSEHQSHSGCVYIHILVISQRSHLQILS